MCHKFVGKAGVRGFLIKELVGHFLSRDQMIDINKYNHITIISLVDCISHCNMFKALSDSADGVSTGGSGASSSSGPVKVGGCPHIGGKAEGSSGLNMRRNVQCPMHVCSDEKRHL